jgi:hypothetical protein
MSEQYPYIYSPVFNKENDPDKTYEQFYNTNWAAFDLSKEFAFEMDSIYDAFRNIPDARNTVTGKVGLDVSYFYLERYPSTSNTNTYLYDKKCTLYSKNDEKFLMSVCDELRSSGQDSSTGNYEVIFSESRRIINAKLLNNDKHLEEYLKSQFYVNNNLWPELPKIDCYLTRHEYNHSLVDAYNQQNEIIPIKKKKEIAPFIANLNDDLIHATEMGIAPWMDDVRRPAYIVNPFDNRMYRGANQFALQLANALNPDQGNPINYAPLEDVQSDKRHWLEDESKPGKKSKVKCTIYYKGVNPDTKSDEWVMSIPTKALKQDVLQEEPGLQPPINGIKKTDLQKTKYKDAEDFLTCQMGQYLNCAATKDRPFNAQEWTPGIVNAVVEAIKADPSMSLRVMKNAYEKSTQMDFAHIKDNERVREPKSFSR